MLAHELCLATQRGRGARHTCAVLRLRLRRLLQLVLMLVWLLLQGLLLLS